MFTDLTHLFATFTQPMLELFATSLWETFVMVGVSGVLGALLGVPLGVFLRLSDRGGVLESLAANTSRKSSAM